MSNQTTKPGITLSPALTTIAPGKSYALSVKNTGDQTVEVKLNPALFAVDAETNKVVPAPSTAYTPNQPLNAYLNVTQANFSLAAGESKAIEIKYGKEYPSFLLGVEASVGRFQEEANVGTVGKLSSVIISTDITDSDLTKLDSSLNAKPKFAIGSVNLGTDVNLVTKFQNNSNKLVKGSGDISIYSGEKRVENIVLTSDMPPSVYPGVGFEIQNSYKDSRPFWQRIGTTAYRQQITVSGKTITREVQQLSLPWEFLLIVLVLTIVVFASAYAGSRYYLRRQNKPLKKSGIQHRNKLGASKSLPLKHK
jgi:hypothetical protein